MPKILTSECTACGACVDVCPLDAIVIEDVAIIDETKCAGCGICLDECSFSAIVE